MRTSEVALLNSSVCINGRIIRWRPGEDDLAVHNEEENTIKRWKYEMVCLE